MSKSLRAQFENWCTDEIAPTEISPGYLFQRDDDGDYVVDWVDHRWTAYRDGRKIQAAEDERIAHRQAADDDALAEKYPDEARKMEDRAHRARTIATAIKDNVRKIEDGE